MNNKNNLLIFGTGKIAEAVSYFFNRDSEYNIVGYIIDEEYQVCENYLGKQVYNIKYVINEFDRNEFSIFVALGYQGINKLRTEKYQLLKNSGFSFASYKSPNVQSQYTIGENSIIMDGAIIQPPVTIGNNVFIWGGAMIGHHAIIEDNSWITGGAMIGGVVKFGAGSFAGVGAIVGHEINIGKECMLGAGCVICKSIPDKTVLIQPNTEPHRLNSEQFIRMSTCFRV